MRCTLGQGTRCSRPQTGSSITLADMLVGPARRDWLAAARATAAELDDEAIPLGEDAPARRAAAAA